MVFFVSPGLSDSVIAFMRDYPLEGRLWLFKITCDKPWAWPEVNFWKNSIEMQKHFIKESNCHFVWDTTGETNLTTKKAPRLAVLTYAAVEWLSKGGQTTNDFRVCLEQMERNDANSQKN